MPFRTSRRAFAVWSRMPGILLAAVLAACGMAAAGDAPRPGRLVIAGAGATVLTCRVNDEGGVLPCEPGHGLASPGSRAIWADLAQSGTTPDVSACRSLAAVGADASCASTVAARQLATPYGTAVSSGRVYISQRDDALAICTLDGQGLVTRCQRAWDPQFFAEPAGVATAGRFVFVANQRDHTVAACLLSSTGGLANCTRQPLGGLANRPAGVAHDKGRLYVTNLGDNSITTCRIGVGGRLEQCSRFADPDVLDGPLGIALNGARAYVANLGSRSLAECRLDALGAIVSCRQVQAGEAFGRAGGMAFHPDAS